MMRRGGALFVVLLLSLAVKAALLGVALRDPGRLVEPDSHTYDDSARALLRTGSFAVSPDHPEVPQTLRTPGYPLFLAAAYRIFGEGHVAPIGLQLILSLGAIALTWSLGRRLWDERVALLAAAFLALDVVSLSHALLLLTETLFGLALLLAALAAVRVAAGAGGGLAAAALGTLLGAAALIRPVAYYLALPLLAALVLHGRIALRRPWPDLARAAALALLPLAVLLGGWHLRNLVATGNPEFSQIEGVNALFHRAAGIAALRDGVSLEEAQRRLAPEGYVALAGRAMLHPEERPGREWKRTAYDLAVRHPLLLARMTMAGAARLLLGTGEDAALRLAGAATEGGGPLGDLRRLSPAAYVRRWPIGAPLRFALFAGALIYLLAIYAGIGLWIAARAGPWLHWRAGRGGEDARPAGGPACTAGDPFRPGAHLVLWVIALYLVAVSAGPEAYYRFRLPLMPILALYAAAGWTAFRARRRARAGGSTPVAQGAGEAPR